MKKTKSTYTQNDSIIVNTLKSAGKPLTLNELNELANSEIKPSQMTSACNKGLISSAGGVKVDRKTFRFVNTYKYVNDHIEEGKNFTDVQKEILAAAKQFGDNEFTTEQLNKAADKKFPVSTISSLVRRGNLNVSGKIKTPRISQSTVLAYVYIKDIPSE